MIFAGDLPFITIKLIIISKLEEIASGEWMKIATECKIL
jgi:hypothetical protein